MNFRTMFPSKYLTCDDIPGGQMIVVTIARIVPISARVGFGQQGQQPQMSEPLWAMYLHEYPKPLKLKAYKCEAIESALGTAETERWIGRRIKIFAGSVPVGGESKPVVLIDPTPVPGTALPAPTQPAAAPGAPAPPDTRPIGMGNADRFREALAEQGATFDEFLAWLKRTDQAGFEAAYGRYVDALPRWLAPLMHRFLREYSAKPVQPAAEPEISFGAPPPAAAAPPPQLPEEDIPF